MTISGEIQGGRPLHFLRLLSRYPLLEYGTIYIYVIYYIAVKHQVVCQDRLRTKTE